MRKKLYFGIIIEDVPVFERTQSQYMKHVRHCSISTSSTPSNRPYAFDQHVTSIFLYAKQKGFNSFQNTLGPNRNATANFAPNCQR